LAAIICISDATGEAMKIDGQNLLSGFKQNTVSFLVNLFQLSPGHFLFSVYKTSWVFLSILSKTESYLRYFCLKVLLILFESSAEGDNNRDTSFL